MLSSTVVLVLVLLIQSLSFVNAKASVCTPTNLSASEEHVALLQSPDYPNNYPPDSECWWTIIAPVGYHVQISIITLELKIGFDRLWLFDAPSKEAVAKPFTDLGTNEFLNRSLLTDSNYVTVKFTSNMSVQRRGFELMYKAIVIFCPTLLSPSNGKKRCYADNISNQFCNFQCDVTFMLNGTARRWCQSDGSWTGEPVSCHKMSCTNLPVPDNGVKTSKNCKKRYQGVSFTVRRCTDGNYVDSSCSFTCDVGYVVHGYADRQCHVLPQINIAAWSIGFGASCQSSPPTPTCNVNKEWICDGYYNCFDRSDEKGCSCPSYKLKCDCYETGCRSMWGCLTATLRCDGYDACGDWSDEKNCKCSDTRFQCQNGDCIDRWRVNDGNTDCVNGDDEFNCTTTQGHVRCGCLHDSDRCASSGRCIPSSWVGDTISDCENHDDEPCNATKVWCDNCWLTVNRCLTRKSKAIFLRNTLQNYTTCHSVFNPSDQNQAHWICISSTCGKCSDMFQCESGQIIDKRHYCDRVDQCNDGSDETIKQFGFRCSGMSRTSDCVLPQRNVYDSVAQCADSSDLCFVNGDFRCFSCLDGRLIVSAKQVCDGYVDCYDMSDECLCSNQSVCDVIRGKERSRCPLNQMHCYNDTDCVDMTKVLCNPSHHCGNESNQMFCHQDLRSSNTVFCSILSQKENRLINVKATRCDGRPECGRLEDECYCQPQPSFCRSGCAMEILRLASLFNNIDQYYTGNRICDGRNGDFEWNWWCNHTAEENCTMRFYCKSKDKISIDKESVCDGIYDCDDHSDEDKTNCSNTRFRCQKGNAFSIDKLFTCDGIKDCDDGEDETRQLCGIKRFYCSSGKPISVDRTSVENGIKDCSDGSDECISLFSDQYEMIANPALRALFWIMGFLALIGNIVVHYHTAKDLICAKNSKAVKRANDFFILNLTISDFLTGVYLIAVVSQGVRYSGFYCFVDKQWRSSDLCSALGTIVVLSSETSVFIMAVMSTFRLITVYKPFLSSSIELKWIVTATCSCWLLSTLLAVLPWFPFDSGYFISDVWFPNMFLKTDTVSKPNMFILATRISDQNSTSKSWSRIKEIISNTFKYNPIKGEFGYYGKTSVCMPRFYSTTNEAAWQYSTLIITINFVLFIYMVSAYLLVWKKAGAMKKSRSNKKDPNKGMQKRISRLLLSDFCCWIPVCILSYLSIAGVPLSPNAYVVSAGFLLPINSATNPILYSKFISRYGSRAKKWIIQKCSCIYSRHTCENNSGERNESGAMMTQL